MDDDPDDCCQCSRCNPIVISCFKLREISFVPNPDHSQRWIEPIVIELGYDLYH